jgi:uncharacterized membrane protein
VSVFSPLQHSSWHWHPRVKTGGQLPIADRAVDTVVAFLGSFRYLAWQTVALVIWVLLNVRWAIPQLMMHPWDPYPFIFLNLAMSAQAAYAAPLILAAGIRADAKREAVAAETHEGVAELRQHAQESRAQLRELQDKVDRLVAHL